MFVCVFLRWLRKEFKALDALGEFGIGDEFMKVEKFGALLPFLLVDAVLVFAMVWLLHLDWVVHNMLYGFGLQFSLDWAVPYWVAFRASLVLLLFGIAVVSVVGYFSFQRVTFERERMVFICKSCGNAWAEVDKGVKVRVRGELPKFRILRSCPSCDKRLLDLETGFIQNDELEAREGTKRQETEHG